MGSLRRDRLRFIPYSYALKTRLYLTCEKKNYFLEYIELHFF
jgi:hypothetical protein